MGIIQIDVERSKLGSISLQLLQEQSLCTARYRQPLLENETRLIEGVGTGIIAITTLANQTSELWHLSCKDNIDAFAQAITQDKPSSVFLIVGSTDPFDDIHVEHYPFYAEVLAHCMTVLDLTPSTSETVLKCHAIKPTDSLTIHMKDQYSLLESVATHQLKSDTAIDAITSLRKFKTVAESPKVIARKSLPATLLNTTGAHTSSTNPAPKAHNPRSRRKSINSDNKPLTPTFDAIMAATRKPTTPQTNTITLATNISEKANSSFSQEG